MNRPPCTHWHGHCVLGLYGGHPSPGVCAQCPQRQEEAPYRVRLRQYLAAEVSLVKEGPVDDDVYAHRLSVCTGKFVFVDDNGGKWMSFVSESAVSEPCANLRKEGATLYCGSCGCGNRERAALHISALMPKKSCPAHKWSSMPGTGWRAGYEWAKISVRKAMRLFAQELRRTMRNGDDDGPSQDKPAVPEPGR